MQGRLAENLLLYKVRTRKDPEAFGQLYDLYIQKIYRFVYFKLNNKEESEDLTSEVFLKVWHYLIGDENREITSFSGLVYKVARNCLIDLYRERSKKQEMPLDENIEIKTDNKEIKDFENLQEAEKIIGLLKYLKEDYQEVIMLNYIEELSAGEIAEILDKSQVWVRVTIHRALKKLKELADEKKYQP